MNLNQKVDNQPFICGILVSFKGDLISNHTSEESNFFETTPIDSNFIDIYFTKSTVKYKEASKTIRGNTYYIQNLSIRFPSNDKNRSLKLKEFEKVKFLKLKLTSGEELALGRNDYKQNTFPKVKINSNEKTTFISFTIESIFPLGYSSLTSTADLELKLNISAFPLTLPHLQMANTIPLNIRPHLIPFFYREFVGEEAKYLNKKVKAAKISVNSSLGKQIVEALKKADYPVKPEKFNMYITVSLDGVKKNYSAKFYKFISGEYCFLKVNQDLNETINNILEDYFRIAFVYAIEFAEKFVPDVTIKQMIEAFMVEYELDNHGYTVDSMRRLLDRGRENKISRIQHKPANRIKTSKQSCRKIKNKIFLI